MKTITKKNFKEIIEKQMKINWYNNIKYEDLVEKSKKWEAWYSEYTTTPEKEEVFKNWLDNYLKDNFKSRNKKTREKTIDWFILEFWLRKVEKK